MMDYTNRMWRTLLRVVSKEDDKLRVVIPGWNPREQIEIPYNIIPPEILAGLEPGSRFHARVNIGAEEAEDLRFEGWESS
jgi:hypothetical protein